MYGNIGRRRASRSSRGENNDCQWERFADALALTHSDVCSPRALRSPTRFIARAILCPCFANTRHVRVQDAHTVLICYCNDERWYRCGAGRSSHRRAFVVLQTHPRTFYSITRTFFLCVHSAVEHMPTRNLFPYLVQTRRC